MRYNPGIQDDAVVVVVVVVVVVAVVVVVVVVDDVTQHWQRIHQPPHSTIPRFCSKMHDLDFFFFYYRRYFPTAAVISVGLS